MIVDFVLDVVFGLANFIVGLLPVGAQLAAEESWLWTTGDNVINSGVLETIKGIIGAANYWLPLNEWATVVSHMFWPVAGFVVLYRFIKAFKPWG